MVLLQAVGDEIADRADLQAVGPGKLHEVVQSSHGPVVPHDLADHSAGVQAGEARDVDSGLRVTGPDQDSAGLCDEREDMAG